MLTEKKIYDSWKKRFRCPVSSRKKSSLISLDQFRAESEKTVAVGKLEEEFIRMIRKIAKVMKQGKYNLPRTIISVFDSRGISRINRFRNQKDFYRFLRDRAKRGESVVVPEKKLVLLATSIRSHLAEEAAHYLRLSGRKNVDYGRTGIVVEEALAFFASLLFSPNRKIPKIRSKKTAWDEVHAEGYELGRRLWRVWKRRSSRNRLRELWLTYPKNEPEYQIVFFRLTDLR